MDVTAEKGEAGCRLSVRGDMTIYTVSECKRKLLSCLEEGLAVEIDCQEVGEMDTAGLQLLILAQRESARLNGSLRLGALSGAVQQVVDLYRMAPFFADRAAALEGQ